MGEPPVNIPFMGEPPVKRRKTDLETQKGLKLIEKKLQNIKYAYENDLRTTYFIQLVEKVFRNKVVNLKTLSKPLKTAYGNNRILFIYYKNPKRIVLKPLVIDWLKVNILQFQTLITEE